MKKVVFAKIFELEKHQVLITKEYEDDKFRINQTTDIDSCVPTLALIFDNEEKRDQCFEDYTKDNAIKFVENVVKMLEF